MDDAQGGYGSKMKKKFMDVLQKNPGWKDIQLIADILRVCGKTVKVVRDELGVELDPTDIGVLKYAPVTAVDVERSFSHYKSILRPNRRYFLFENLKKLVICNCNSSVDQQVGTWYATFFLNSHNVMFLLSCFSFEFEFCTLLFAVHVFLLIAAFCIFSVFNCIFYQIYLHIYVHILMFLLHIIHSPSNDHSSLGHPHLLRDKQVEDLYYMKVKYVSIESQSASALFTAHVASAQTLLSVIHPYVATVTCAALCRTAV